MSYRIVFAPEAETQLAALYDFIADAVSPDIAENYTGAIVDQCEALARFPLRGTPRDDVRPGLRTISFRRRVTIAYAVAATNVTILGIFYAGQDFTSLLAEG
jgi:toxin ParE1/3/4